MMKVKAIAYVATALGIGIVAFAAAQAPEEPAPPGGGAAALTAMDYVEIQQLVARYAWAVDQHGGDGYVYADLFTPDGSMGDALGREELAALARRTQAERSGPAFVRHFVTNVIITPTADGATGRQYNVAIDVGEDGKSSTIVHGGVYQDVYARTPQGWRFKSRNYVRSQLGERPADAAR
jgi:hypothetical protein